MSAGIIEKVFVVRDERSRPDRML